MEWKWSKGEPYERSKRPSAAFVQERRDVLENQQIFSAVQEQGAYTSALNHDESTWDMLNQSIYNNGFRQSNKREDLDTKMADRAMVQQRGFNPFLSGSDYANDISVSNTFLQPINTTQDRVTSETNY
jgi:hypothetical protein